jgi:hypothetical protein
MTSQIKVRVADQNAVKVVSSFKSPKGITISDISGIDVTGAINKSLLEYNSLTGKWVVTNSIDGNVNPAIKIKRSTSSSIVPTLSSGELGITVGVGTVGNIGGRLWIGDNLGNSVQIGGQYYVQILDHEPGVLTPNSSIIVNENSYIDYLNILNDVIVGGGLTANGLKINGNIYNSGITTITQRATIGGVGITSNIISTKPGYGDVLYIDPNPDGLDNSGTVIIKGNLQVDGQSSVVNSTTLSTNEIIVNLGDPTSIRTIKGNISIGSSIFTLDSVVGINTGDVVSDVTGLPVSTVSRTVTTFNTINKTITIAGSTTVGITSSSQLTITHGYDTNTDRGISFTYNNSSIGIGITANTLGYFGFVDSNKKWTYIPDATITNGVVSGTKGYLDIKGIYYQSTDISQYGISYFDSDGFLNSTTSPSAGITTSNYILTTQPGTNVPVWTSALDGGGY